MRVDTEPEGSAERISRRLAAFPEPGLKLAYLRDVLAGCTAREAVELLGLALGERGRSRGSDELALLVLLLLAGPGGSDVRREALASQAMRIGLTDVAFFVAPRAAEVPEVAKGALPYQGRPLTLGERKSLARGRERELLARVIRDPHPDVIAIILSNPALTETDVVRLSARRPNMPKVLESVLGTVPWSLRYDVRTALLQNPYLPLGLAVPLVASVRHHDAKAFEAAGDLRPEIRQAAARVTSRIDARSH